MKLRTWIKLLLTVGGFGWGLSTFSYIALVRLLLLDAFKRKGALDLLVYYQITCIMIILTRPIH